MLDDWHFDSSLGLTLLKSEGSLFTMVIFSWSSSVISFSKLLSFIINGDNTITSILSNDNNFCKFIGGNSLDGSALLETDLSWLVVINNGYSGLAVLSN